MPYWKEKSKWMYIVLKAMVECERFDKKIDYSESIENCVKNSDIIVIATPWPQFSDIENLLDDKIVIDCWRILDKKKKGGNVNYKAVGIGNLRK